MSTTSRGRAPHLVAEPPHVLLRRVVQAHVDAEPLRIEAPALDEGGEEGRRTCATRASSSSCWSAICMVMAGHRLVHRQHRDFPQRPLVELGRVDEIEAGDARRPGCPAGSARWCRPARSRRSSAGCRRAGAASRPNRLGILPSIVLVTIAVASSSSSGVLAYYLGLVRMSAIIASRLAKPAFFATCLHLGADARDLLQADLVDLVGRQVGRRVLARPGRRNIPCPAAASRRRTTLRHLGTSSRS